MRKLVFILFSLLIGITALSGQEAEAPQVLGILTYLEGEVDVYRNGEQLSWYDVDIGLEVEEYDLIKTGSDGTADIELELPSRRAVSVHISPNTAFYFSLGQLESGTQTRFDMLKGTIGFKVKRLAFAGEVAVRTQAVAMGVRGTEFEVTTAPEGSLLITCSEGEVVCFDDEGGQQLAIAGRVVEKTDTEFRGVDVPVSDLDAYRTNWEKEREEIFVSGASFFISGFATLYLEYQPEFEKAFDQLRKQRRIFEEWAERKTGTDADLGSLLLQRRDVTPGIIAMRSVFPYFEQLFYRLQVLGRYHAEGIGLTSIRRNLTSAQFFRGFDREQQFLEEKFALVRYYFKLFAWSDSFSDSDIMDDIFSDTNPLGGDGPPKPSDPRSAN
ncbi:MAG: FecR domain-containing protein [Spirochaetales bacterium]|jgi:hypothetical protein|nr:FecR domain-containing protein [Spirochaetales bacterium]